MTKFITGKLYRVTDHIHPWEDEFTGWGTGLKLRPGPWKSFAGSTFNNWIDIQEGDVVMWIGETRSFTTSNFFNTALYKDHGVCVIDPAWDQEDLSKKLVLVGRK